jgi:hypothetical protein
MAASFVAEIVIQTNANVITLVWPGSQAAKDMAVAWIADKPDTAPVVPPADWEPLGTPTVVGTGVAGVDTGPLRLSAFFTLLKQGSPANPVFTATGGNAAAGYGQIWRKTDAESWLTPTATSGSDATHDLNFSSTGAANLGAVAGDVIAAMSAGTANSGPTGRGLTVPGTTGVLTAINSGGNAAGNHLFVWGDRYAVTTGPESGAPVSTATFAVNQSGGAAFTRLGTVSSPSSLSKFGASLTYHMNRKAGTLNGNDQPTLSATEAANLWAGTSGMTVVGALNVKAGNTLPAYLELLGVLNQLAGTTGLGTQEAAASIP